MKLIEYISDKKVYIVLNFFSLILITLLLLLFNTNNLLIVFILTIQITNFLIPIIYEYVKKRMFYNNFKKSLDKLKEKYLITEIIKYSNNLDGNILLEYLNIIDKYMHEEVNKFKSSFNELKEYIELWCHEIKTPVATTKLIIENNKNFITTGILEETEKIEYYIEQILFYARSDNVEEDYLIKKVNLNNLVNNVIKRNKKNLITKKIKIEIEKLDSVLSDSKWLEFIMNQIVINSIKYSNKKNPYIKIYTKQSKNNVILYIEDNGIGIKDIELSKVFDKGFTGSNGRIINNATGIGLYLCKKLCKKLNHSIEIESKINEFTIVKIVFPNNSLTDM